jgi:hypothetical protein
MSLNDEFIMYEVPMLCGIWMAMRSCDRGVSMCMDASMVTQGSSSTFFVATTKSRALLSLYSWQGLRSMVGQVEGEETMGERTTE